MRFSYFKTFFATALTIVTLHLCACTNNETTKTSDIVIPEFQMVKIPGGEFMMGGNVNDDEQPLRKVTIPSFYISKYEVTQEEWYAVMGNNPSTFKGSKLPVENVSWDDIQEFLKKIGKGYRLPSESEWEYAVRSGSTEEFSFGIGSNPNLLIDDFAWYVGNSSSTTHQVGTKKPNKYGLFDMEGNVWEWCEDDYHFTYDKAPINEAAWVDEPRAAYRVIRGGSWYDSATRCRSASRIKYEPGYRTSYVGFRLSKALP